MAEGGAGDSMWAAHSAGFTVNISKFPSTQVADDDTKAHTHTHAHTSPHTLRRSGASAEKRAASDSAASEMRKRLIQILGFLLTSLGWVFVLCTLAMDYWRITQIGGQGGSFIIKVAWYWSNLWKDCFTDSTAVTNCRDFPVLWTVTRKNWALIGTVHDYVCVFTQMVLLEESSGHVFGVTRPVMLVVLTPLPLTLCPSCCPLAFVQGVRGLLMCGITLGFFAVVLCFVGMECTYIGGPNKIKDKLVFAGAVFHFAGGECGSRPWQQ